MKLIFLLWINFSTLLALFDYKEDRDFYSRRAATIHLNGKPDLICYGGFISNNVVLTSATCIGTFGKVEENANFNSYKFHAFDPKTLNVVFLQKVKTEVKEVYIHDYFGLTFFSDKYFVFNIGLLTVENGNPDFFTLAPMHPTMGKLSTCFYERSFYYIREITTSDNFYGDSCTDVFCISDPECTRDVKFSEENEGFRCASEFTNNGPDVHRQHYGALVMCDRKVHGVVTKLGPTITYWARTDDEFSHPFIQKILNKNL